MVEELSWKDFPVAGPIVASLFAFAYNVGYFEAIDIGWFSFFSLSDHVTFAIRALPVAVAASVGLLIALAIPELEQKLTNGYGRKALTSVLFIFAAISLFFLHGGLFFAFLLFGIAAKYYPWVLKRISSVRTRSFASIVYSTVLFFVLSFTAGVISAWVAKIPPDFQSRPSVSFSVQNNHHNGRVVFSGTEAALIYERNCGMYLIKRKDIGEIREPDIQSANLWDAASKGLKSPSNLVGAVWNWVTKSVSSSECAG